jgi:hypothetical protein
MSTRLGKSILYLNIGEFNKILKLDDYQDMEIDDITKNKRDIEFKIVVPLDSSKSSDMVVLTDCFDSVKRRGICLEAPEDSWYIGLDKDDLDKSNEELGKLIKEKCDTILKEDGFEDIETINFKIFLNKKYE